MTLTMNNEEQLEKMTVQPLTVIICYLIITVKHLIFSIFVRYLLAKKIISFKALLLLIEILNLFWPKGVIENYLRSKYS